MSQSLYTFGSTEIMADTVISLKFVMVTGSAWVEEESGFPLVGSAWVGEESKLPFVLDKL